LDDDQDGDSTVAASRCLSSVGSAHWRADLQLTTCTHRSEDNTMRRTISFAAVAAIAALAACSDSPTSPSTNARPVDGASALIVKPIFLATVTVREEDINNALVFDGTTKVKFSTSPADTFTVADNSPQDADNTMGIVKVVMSKAATYTACFVSSAFYAADAASGLNPCSTVSTTSSTVDLGAIHVQRKPMIIAQVKDQLGNMIGGATMQFSDATRGFSVTTLDNDANDQWNNAAGLILRAFEGPGTFRVCETAAPTNAKLLTQQCFDQQLGWNQMYWPTFTHFVKQ
jgi:hypothetical protein